MKRYFIKRAVSFVLIVIGVSLLGFLLIAFSGKDPAEIIARRGNANATPEMIEQVRIEMGLDGTLPERYVNWAKGFFTGDFGMSISTYHPISEDISQFLPVTLTMVALALLWTAILSVPISILCAKYKNGFFDHITRGVTIFGICIPTFWLGYMGLVIFAIKMKWCTVVPTGRFSDLILPSIVLAVPVICGVVRMLRATLLAELSSDYVRYAKARGLSSKRILINHVLRNALPPIITVFCQYFGAMIASSAVMEGVFSINGIGSYMIASVIAADSIATATCVVIVAVVFICANTLGDIINRLLCPWIVREINGD
ncbi:MAG: ABC transporter permease [Lachnospiraceae bacterium]|nr:ABC transporter permease [Lachnospiraceae bacterium]